MTPVHCRVSHDPENGKWGDCLRAVIASLLDLAPESVPHFSDNGVSAETANAAMCDYLATHGLAPWWSHYDPELPIDEVLSIVGGNNPGIYYLLFGVTASGESHVVICRDNKVDWNPSWYGGTLVGPGKHGAWSIVVLVRK